jgi:uncharacterized protein (TIGR04255 family)
VEKTITFENAPLVELVVEVRWPVKSVKLPNGMNIITDTSAIFDQWYKGLLEELQKAGYSSMERIVPQEMLPIAQQPVFRFTKAGEKFPLVQFGYGVFTVNAGPPSYVSWENLRPEVERNIGLLLSMMPKEAGVESFEHVSLRYIDSFEEKHRDGQSNYAFIRDILGVKVNLPQGLVDYADDIDNVTPTIAMRLPVKGTTGSTIMFQAAAGRIGQQPDLSSIIDMTFAVANKTQAKVHEVLSVLDNAHTVLHDWFMKITKDERLTASMAPLKQAK